VIDVFRRSDWNRTIIQGSDHFDIDPVPLLETLAHPGETPENELSARLEKAHLARGLAQLTELQRRALNLRLIEQLPYEEIAEQLELSLSSVKGLIFRAKQRLLDEMREPQATPG
jgi:RNA polymerase sigma-70 factor (ECF subfamily)